MLRLCVFLAALALPAAAADCPDCKAPKTCDRHTEKDKTAAARFQDEFRNADPAVRAQALDAFGAALDEHANVRTPLAAQLFGVALKDAAPAVRARAAELLGAYGEASAACQALGRDIETIVKKLNKQPKGEKEEADWLANFDTLTGIARGLAATGSPLAGAHFARILASTRLKVLTMVSDHCHKVRARDTVEAVLEALDRVRNTPANADRDKAYLALMTCWEKLTTSGVRNPTPGDTADNTRFIQDCRKWWKTNKDTWK